MLGKIGMSAALDQLKAPNLRMTPYITSVIGCGGGSATFLSGHLLLHSLERALADKPLPMEASPA